MYTDMRHYRVRQEQNQALLQAAAFERWLTQVTPHHAQREPVLLKIARWFGAWLAGWQESIPCSDLAPACGLQIAA